MATLPDNMRHANGAAVFILLDYNDQDGLGDYILREHRADLDAGRLVYYRNKDALRFHMGHAKNQAHRCALMEGATHLITLDADNLTGPGFIDYVCHQFTADPELSFLCPDFDTLPPKGHRFNRNNPVRLGRGFAGRLAIRAQDFIKAGGYNEVFDTWRGEDIDLIARLNRLGLKKAAIEPVFLNAIAHSSQVRFREYPEAEKFENDDIYGIVAQAHDTVANHGEIGCGRVFRNFSLVPTVIEPLATRVFGIGMQRTGTSSLDAAFKSFGFDAGHWESAEWARAIWWEMNKWGRSRTLEQRYALTDNPIPMLYRKLDVAYPGSKFVLTVRDETEWLDSMERFWTYDGNPSRWMWDVDGFSHKMHAIIYGTPEFDRETMLARYRRHNEEVLAYFRNRPDLLLIDLQGSPQTNMNALCRFLGRPVTNAAFPHRNKGVINVSSTQASQAPPPAPPPQPPAVDTAGCDDVGRLNLPAENVGQADTVAEAAPALAPRRHWPIEWLRRAWGSVLRLWR